MDLDFLLVVSGPEPLPEHVFLWVDPEWRGAWAKRDRRAPCAAFRVQFRMEPLKPGFFWRGPPPSYSLNSTVKVNFFLPPGRETNAPDFQFASVFPLSCLEGVVYGLWNANRSVCDAREWAPLPHYVLTVATAHVAPAGLILNVAPAGLVLNGAPNPSTHTEAIRISAWLKQALRACCEPGDPTTFTYVRTFLRNPWTDTFFFDLHRLFTKEPRTTQLPPTLALYAVANALIVHGLDAGKLLRGAFEVDRFLAFMRDVLMCYSLCQKEGMYRDDLLEGKEVQDQEHPFSQRTEDDTVFDEDDCEGRNVQGCVHMKQLFCEIAGAPEFELEEEPLLRVGRETMRVLVALARRIGRMFLDGQLRAFMCAGDCAAKSMGALAAGGSKVQGHSYGLLLYKGGGAVLLETTGYEYRHEMRSPAVGQATKELLGILRGAPSAFAMRMTFTPELEDRIYVKAFAGDDALFFTRRADGVFYGASPSLLSRRAVDYAEGPGPEGECALVVRPADFLQRLADGKGLWPRMVGAEAIRDAYAAFAARYPAYRREIMPPQVPQAELLASMRRLWSPIDEAALQNRRPPADLAFSVRRDRPMPPALAKWLAGRDVHAHAFMASTFYRVYV
jgi:hypothetical protein